MPRLGCALAAWTCLAGAMLPEARGSVGDELAALAAIHGASGDESRVIEFIRERIPGELRTGANGSLVATFGEGSPRILVIAGIDEPGLLVSGIHERGYLWLRPMAEGPIGGGPARYFRGQHVHVSTRSGSLIPGVVAAPSVHFASIRGARRNEADGALLVDIGASSARQAAAAGVAVLDRVTLEKESRYLAGGWLATPWVSSRAGAALLLTLGQTLEQHRFAGTVTLAFVTQQYPHNAGLGRVLGSVPADHVVLIAPNGGTRSEIAPATGSDPSATAAFADLAREVGVRLERKYAHALDFGPFGRVPWQSDQQLLVLRPAVRNAGTPAETVSTAELEGPRSIPAPRRRPAGRGRSGRGSSHHVAHGKHFESATYEARTRRVNQDLGRAAGDQRQGRASPRSHPGAAPERAGSGQPCGRCGQLGRAAGPRRRGVRRLHRSHGRDRL